MSKSQSPDPHPAPNPQPGDESTGDHRTQTQAQRDNPNAHVNLDSPQSQAQINASNQSLQDQVNVDSNARAQQLAKGGQRPTLGADSTPTPVETDALVHAVVRDALAGTSPNTMLALEALCGTTAIAAEVAKFADDPNYGANAGKWLAQYATRPIPPRTAATATQPPRK